ncbi:MAG: bifunctional phosphopantothenoylcysteine decarboxylase/phosphopantothenate--cysteine ligase CoaBC [Firmicutes bacterium]|nr:bifunctional phosphopantothenoylcysteine decarboxylase/phosphopantothenate--cysteine ligase CoaBC [Bacillota bacterium]
MGLNGKTFILGVTGGIAVYKVPELISRLRRKGLNVEVIMTKAAAEFVTPLTFREVSRNPVHLEMFGNDFEWRVEHISLAQKADLFGVIPATANIIGKIANGIADDLLTTSIMAATAPKIIAPAMNPAMYHNPIFQKNLKTLAENGYYIVEPACGEVLCGDQGIGRLAELDDLILAVEKCLSVQDLSGETVLITAGGAKEPLDPVRYLGNRSSGKMGHALAEAAYKRGAKVLLVTAAALPTNPGITTFRVETTAAMRSKTLELAAEASIIIKSAAPADYRPEKIAAQKIKKNEVEFNLKLIPNPDILLELGRAKQPNQILVGFAAETESLKENALAKLNRKNLDLIVANLVGSPGTGMGSDRNRVTIYTKEEAVEIPEMSKILLADVILDHILNYKNKRVLTA